MPGDGDPNAGQPAHGQASRPPALGRRSRRTLTYVQLKLRIELRKSAANQNMPAPAMTAISVGAASRTGVRSHQLAKNRIGPSLRMFSVATRNGNVTYATIAGR